MGPTQPPVQWMLMALSPRVKWSGLEADHSHPSSAEVKKEWSCSSTPCMFSQCVEEWLYFTSSSVFDVKFTDSYNLNRSF